MACAKSTLVTGLTFTLGAAVAATLHYSQCLVPLQWLVEKFVETEHVDLALMATEVFWVLQALPALTRALGNSSWTVLSNRTRLWHQDAEGSLPLFALSVILAHLTQVPVDIRNHFALAYVSSQTVSGLLALFGWTYAYTVSHYTSTSAVGYLVCFALFRNFDDLYQWFFQLAGMKWKQGDVAPEQIVTSPKGEL
ncbi:hypothetical protein IWQ62_001974 [Dispira parvispora]|uniref:Uncharacterized protein n=1 Tax=Dispira parvispora TaxID=1520584 RepID=A0A9W8E8H3_9FUNG|nr:hypothetical protein IWQ62_001974 [Dispira parvispora]